MSPVKRPHLIFLYSFAAAFGVAMFFFNPARTRGQVIFRSGLIVFALAGLAALALTRPKGAGPA